MRNITPTTPQQKLAVQFHRVNNLLHRLRCAKRHAAPSDQKEKVSFHRGQGRVLALLNNEESLSIAQLVELLDVRPSSAGELVSKLEQSGYVVRSSSDEDKRVALISITEEGKAILETMGEANTEYFDEVFSGLSPEEQEQLAELLEKLIVSLKEKGEEMGVKFGKEGKQHGSHRSHRGHHHHHGHRRGDCTAL